VSGAGEGRPGGAGGNGRAGEDRLDALREEARRTGSVEGRGVDVEGGPIPAGASGKPGGSGAAARAPAAVKGPQAAARAADGDGPGYYGQPVVKPPVWTWEVPVYFFVGGLAGMSGVIAAASRFMTGALDVAVPALWIAALGAAASGLLLVRDLGRSSRFLNMLRVFKRRSPMSVGAWTLTGFGGASTAALVLGSVQAHLAVSGGGSPALSVLLTIFLLASGLLGAVLGTYTGVLIGATAIPAWFEHRLLLPAHFGIAGLGSAAALLQILGLGRPSLVAVALAASGAECLVGLTVELDRHGAADRALREGGSGALLRLGGLLAGPAALVLWIVPVPIVASAVFLAGALVSRFGWLAAGRASARDPAATFAAQRMDA